MYLLESIFSLRLALLSIYGSRMLSDRLKINYSVYEETCHAVWLIDVSYPTH